MVQFHVTSGELVIEPLSTTTRTPSPDPLIP